MDESIVKVLGSELVSKGGKVDMDEENIQTGIASSDANYLSDSMWESIADLKEYPNRSMGYKAEINSFVVQGFAENVEFHILIPMEEKGTVSLRLLFLYSKITPTTLREIKDSLIKVINETLESVKSKRLKKYKLVYSVDSSRRLDGVYQIGKYTLMPCKITEKNQYLGCSNFALLFEVEALTKIRARDIGLREAKEFVAFLSCLTRRSIRLSYVHHSPLKFGPSSCETVEKFEGKMLETAFHIESNPKEGEFEDVKRPDFQRKQKRDLSKCLKLPSDTEDLVYKLYSLPEKEREKFVNACLSYQFAREVSHYPTVSMTALVSAIESMMVGAVTSQYCSDARRKCRYISDVMKKFRMFFERNLEYPLPEDTKRFLNRIYTRRSTFVHKALLGEGRLKGLIVGFPMEDEASEEWWKLAEEHGKLEELVSITLIEWLRRF